MSVTLLNSKTPAILKSEIILKSSGFNGLFLAVEGDFDSRFWGAKIDSMSSRIVHCGGKSNLLGLLNLCADQNYRQLVAVLDADFDRLLGKIKPIWCLSYSDNCDLETTLLCTGVFNKILAEYGDVLKVSGFEQLNQTTTLDYLLRVSGCFGRLRFINTLKDYRVNFDELSPYKYIDTRNWKLNKTNLELDFLHFAQITPEQLARDLYELETMNLSDPWVFVQGHDCLKILSIGLSPAIVGRAGAKSIDQAELQKAIRLSCSDVDIALTNMHKTLKAAESIHGLPLFLL